MDEKRMIKFKFSLGQNDYVVEWPWTDYMSLTYVLHNPSETNILNQGLVKVTQIRQGYFSLSLENENTTFSVAEQAVRHQLSKQRNLEYKYFCASSYPTLLEIINSCELFLTKQVYAEQQGDTIYIAFDKTVLKALDSIIGELFNSSSEDGSSLLFAGKTSPVPTADGSRIAALDSGSADAEKESMGASIGATSDEVEEGGKPTKILVSGVPPRVDSDYLEMFFENTKKHGGGPVANVELNQEDGVAIVEFEKPDAVDVVLQNQRSKPITMTGVEIRVEAYIPEELGDGLIGGDGPTLKILVTKIPERALDEEYLEMFFERKGGAVVDIQLFEEFSAAVVEFDDAEAVVSVMNQPLKMFKTEVEILPYNPKHIPRDTIEVRGQNMHSDVLEMYFESERRSNGGAIEKLHMNEDGDVAYITFSSEEVARRVADKDSHTIARQQHLVEMHQYSDPLTHFLRRNCCLDDFSKQFKHENNSKNTTKDTRERPRALRALSFYELTGMNEYMGYACSTGAGATVGDKAEGPNMATQWDSSELQSSGLEKYVVVKNIPKGYTEEKFLAALITPDFPVRPPSVAYSKTMAEAVLICRDETEATQLLTWTFADRMTASRPAIKNFQSPEAVLPDSTTKKLEKNDSSTKLVAELVRKDIHIGPKNGKLLISAPTLCQVNYALDKIAACFGCKPNTHMSSFEDVTGKAMPENNYKIFKMFRRDEIRAFEKQGGKVSFDGGQLMYTRPLAINIPQNLSNFANEISSQQADDINIEEKWLAKADDWCVDLTNPASKTWCIYEADQHKIIACCKSYDDLQKVKFRLNVLQGKVKVTGRRQRQMGPAEAAAPQQPPMIEKSSDDAAPSLARAGKFQWGKDASNLKGYQTDEGIKVCVYNASIVKLPVDCIVNAANEMLQHGGGVAKVIEDAAGYKLTRESDEYIRKNGNIPVGMCCSTTAGLLPFRRVIHTVGPRWYDYHPHTLQKVKACEEALYMAIMQSLLKAESEGMQSIALPTISSAIFGVPEEICTYQYAKATMDYSRKGQIYQNTLKEIHFVDINVKIIKQIQKRFDAFIAEGNAPSYDIKQFVKRSDLGRSQREEKRPINRQQ